MIAAEGTVFINVP